MTRLICTALFLLFMFSPSGATNCKKCQDSPDTILYITRHGQTAYNAEHKIQGWEDIELNNVGIKQATDSRSKFKELNIGMCFSSPLKRAKATAELALSDTNVKITVLDDLKEKDYGDWNGKVKAWVSSINDGVSFTLLDGPNGETTEAFNNRVARAWHTAVTSASQKPILIVAHGGVFRSIASHLGLETLNIKNLQLIKVSKQKEGWHYETM